MKRNEKLYYSGILAGYYLDKASEEERYIIDKSLKYFNNPTMQYILEQKFHYNKSVRYIEQHLKAPLLILSKSSINNYITTFLEQLKYEFK